MTLDELEKKIRTAIAEYEATYDYPENHTVELKLTLKLIAVVRAAKNMKGKKSIGLAASLAALEGT